ncbi:MAG: oleate hydratase [Candidatus Tyrphobacter sp.]
MEVQGSNGRTEFIKRPSSRRPASSRSRCRTSANQFLARKAGDRLNVVPDGSTNLAFIGQFSELPDGVVFTVECSIRSARIAVCTLLSLDRQSAPMYKGSTRDPCVCSKP